MAHYKVAQAAQIANLTRKLKPKPVVTWDKLERIWRNWEIWQDKDSIVHKLPEHYKKRYWENILRDKKCVHYQAPEVRFEWDAEKNIRLEHEHYPLLVIYPPEADRGLWGGEGIVKGYFESKSIPRYKSLERQWHSKFWYPALLQRCFYSEILDKYMLIWSTRSTVIEVDKHLGLDYYILKTPDIDLCSRFGTRLKREMLLTLARKEYYPDNPEKQEEIEQKYKKFIIPEEEADWIGLDLNEACKKLQDQLELKEKVPLKFKFEKQLLEELKDDPASSGSDSEPIGLYQKVKAKFT